MVKIPKNFLVTGCCGFIGSNMCNFLVERKYNVIGIDNLLTGNIINIKQSSFKDQF